MYMIVHSYVHREGGMGFGDFLRGSLACHQMCFRYGVKVEIDFSQHSIGQYLIPSHTTDVSQFKMLEARNIGSYSVTDLRNLISRNYRFSYLARGLSNIKVYTNVYPKVPISNETKHFVRQALIPTPEFQDIIPVYDHEYEVIHIRAGDLLAFKTAIDFTVNIEEDVLIKSIIKDVKDIISKTTCPIIIMSDSLELKNALTKRCKTIKTDTEPSHMTATSCDAADTLIDYFTLTKARKIHQFSVHPWGSGFSDTVNWIYDVPLQRYQLPQPS